MSSSIAHLSLAHAALNVSSQNAGIDEGMKEAGEKADQAMDAAVTELVTGVVGSAISLATGATTDSSAAPPQRGEKLNPIPSSLSALVHAVPPGGLHVEYERAAQLHVHAADHASDMRDAIKHTLQKMAESSNGWWRK